MDNNQGISLNSEPFDPAAFETGVFVVPEAGWYRFGDGSPVKLTDDEVRAMGFEPPGSPTADQADERNHYVIAVGPDGTPDAEGAPVGPFTSHEAWQLAHPEPDPLSGWCDVVVQVVESPGRDDSDWITPEEAASQYGLSASTWRRLARTGKIRAIKVPRAARP